MASSRTDPDPPPRTDRSVGATRVLIDGRPATADQLAIPALYNYGHFTAMQVRDRAVRGLSAHLERLSSATRELFDTELDLEQVREQLRYAVADTPDAAVRVYVVGAGEPMVMIVLRPPYDAPRGPWRLMSVAYQRPAPHLKHVGGFGQRYYLARVQANGFDEALLAASDGEVAETAIANIGFLRGSEVVWPDAPALSGTTMRLLNERLVERGTPARRVPVYLRDIGSYHGAFVANSIGITPVSVIDDIELPDNPEIGRLVELFESTPRTPI